MDKGKYLITVIAVLILAGHLFYPEFKVDIIAVAILLIAMVPWIPKFLESAKLPGGWELKFRHLEEQVSNVERTIEPIVDSISESDPEETEATKMSEQEYSDDEKKVLKALTDSKFTLRSVSGVSKSSKIDRQRVVALLEKFSTEGKVARVQGKKGIRWALTTEGRNEINKF